MKRNIKGLLILLLAAVVWGASFVAQKVGVEQIEPMTFMGIRTLLGALTLLPFVIAAQKAKTPEEKKAEDKKTLLKAGTICGILLCAATVIQTYGMKTVSSGKSGFITALYMIMVPIIGLFYGKKLTVKTVISVLIAVVGMYLLCMGKESFTMGIGEILILICAFFFALQIIVIDHYVKDVDGVKLSFLQFAVAGTLSLIGALIFDKINIHTILGAWLPILYSGVMSCGVGYTCQVIGQRYAEPTAASIVLSLESVFAVIFGMLLLQEALSLREILGCVVMFAAITYIQLPPFKFKSFASKN